MITRSRIAGVGSYLPPKVWQNDDLKTLMETSDEWISKRTGIKQRHWAEPEDSTSDLGVIAAKNALAAAELDAKDIDMILLATLSPDHEFPGTACFVQAKLGIAGCPALDIRQQCTGFVTGIAVADSFIRTGMYKNILVIGAEIHSKGLDRTTRGRDVAVLFGDGAGAVVMSATQIDASDTHSPQIFSSHLHADGSQAKDLWIEAPGTGRGLPQRVHPEQLQESTAHYPAMNGRAVFVQAVKRMPEAVAECLAANNKTVADVDLFLFHQANLRINESCAKTLGIPEEKIFNTIDRFANTTAATIPLGMDYAIREGKLKPGMLVCTAAFGSGFTWGSNLLRW